MKGKGNWIFFFSYANPGVEIGFMEQLFLVAQISKHREYQIVQ